MSPDLRHHLARWLEQAYMMEKESQALFAALGSEFSEFPAYEPVLETHLQQTAWQLQAVEDGLHVIGGSVPLIKAAAVGVVWLLHSKHSLSAQSDPHRALALAHAFKTFEVSSYQALVAASEQANEAALTSVCTSILRQEHTMARWLDEQRGALLHRWAATTAL